jgi:hypothetical protein
VYLRNNYGFDREGVAVCPFCDFGNKFALYAHTNNGIKCGGCGVVLQFGVSYLRIDYLTKKQLLQLGELFELDVEGLRPLKKQEVKQKLLSMIAEKLS